MNTATPSPPGFWQRATDSILFAILSALILVWMTGNSDRFQVIRLLGAFFLAFASVFFVVVWRRGFRWLFSRRALRFHGGVVVSLFTLVVLFYTEESWRGKRVWAALQREASACGESLEFSSLAPPAVPADQNFAKAPGVAELLGLTRDPDDHSLFYSMFYLGMPSQWPSASWALGQSADLAGWQKFFRDHAEKSDAPERREDTLAFPVPPQPQTPAADVLFALGEFETNLATLRAASQRPVMRLPFDYSKGFFLTMEVGRPAESLWKAVHLLSLRASAELAQGQSEAALQDILLGLQLAEVMSKTPLDYVQRHRRGMIQFCLQPVWDGLAAHRWNNGQLATLQKKLAAVDLPAGYHRGVHGDALLYMNLCDQVLALASGRPSELATRMQPDERVIGWAARTFYPVGWLYQDKTWIYRFYERHADPFQAAAFRNKPWDKLKAEDQTATDPMLVILVLPKLRECFEGSSVGALMMQTFVQQAATACALERFRLAHGQYPETLESLVPDYLAQVPADMLAAPAAKLKYVPAPDGGFKLYSVGFNGVDDGGKPNPSIDPHQDLIWQLSEGNSDLVWIQPGQP